MYVYKESHLEGANMAQSRNQWLNRVGECLDESTQYASGERALTPEAEPRNITRTIADARRDLIDCQNELQDIRQHDDLESLRRKNKSALSPLRGSPL